MVEINNQRKAFLDMLAWSEGTDNGRQKTKVSSCQTSFSPTRSYLLITPRSPSWLLTPTETQINERQTLQLLSRWWDAYRKQLGLKDSLRSRDAVALQQIKGVALCYD